MIKKIINKAFTLIELLVVIAIIGILSGLIIVGMSNSVQSAKIAKAQIFSASLRDSLLMNLLNQYTFNDVTDYNVSTKILNSTAGNVPDSWGKSGGQAYGGPMLSSNCVSGTCLSFDGVDDYVEFSNFADLYYPFTVEFWLKTSSVGAIFGGYNSSFSTKDYIIMTAGGCVNFDQYTPSGGAYCAGSSINNNQWHHIVFSGATSAYKFYIDTVLYTSAAVETYSGGTPTEWNIGHRHYYASPNYLNGSLDELRIYNSDVSISQVRLQYYAGLSKLLSGGGIAKNDYLDKLIAFTN